MTAALALDRIARHDRLAPAWTPESAAGWAWSRIQPTTWRHLVGERRWSAEDYCERTVRSLLCELVAGPAR